MRTSTQTGLSSFSAIIVAIVTVLGLSGVAFASGGAMFTPGSLSTKTGAPLGGITSHAEIQQCSACHAAPWSTETMADRCLVCHTDITAQLQDPTSLHSLVRFGQTDLNCRTCHTEHHGPTASLTRIPPGWDPHDQLGFSLKSHRLRMDGTPFECKDCHQNGYSGPFDQNICGNCHLQINQTFATEHFITFGTDCQACHDGIDTHGKSFDHNQAPFPLAGIHALTACSKCHVSARSLSDLQATTQDCFACHAKDDQHEGRFGTKCGVCHSPEGWGKSAQFDHDLANFKLRGLHLKVACVNCHKNNIYKGIPLDCFSCHQKDDKHAGAFGPQCELCHVADGWNRAVDHSKFAFKLDGKHTTVACETCHINAVFIGTPTDCVSCHKKDDAHAGQFGNQCGTCHTTENWTSATFDHNTVSFKLTAHKTKSDGTAFVCKDCHVKGYASPFDQNVCGNCHLQINQAFAAEHFLTFGTNCMACHDGIDSHGSNFDHNRFPFKLVGKHALAACSNCHLNDRTIADMQATAQQCYSCHQKDDFHDGQFGQDCSACHAPEGWKPAKVDHSKFAFHLDGQHATVACEKCHINGVFKGTPQDCASCHLKDDAHSGQLGTQCETCHVPDGWKPAKVDHSKFAFHLDGKHATAACTDCHKDNLFKSTPTDCASCHLKDDAHAGSLGTQCGTCHSPNGWSPATFDHNTVSFKLTAHQKKSDGTDFACKDCHVKGYASPFDQNTCGDCHLQINQAFATEHFLTFGTNCMACHDGVDSHGKAFDHNKVPFNLIGKHAPVACSQCHINAHTIADLQATAQTCFSCHAKDDHHNGQFGTDCAACHSPEGWQLAKVDHSKFAFHLDGQHATVACEKCHINGVFKGTPQDCASCHLKDDAHSGQLGTQCETCHVPDGWKPAKVDHSKFAFHLDGKHATAACTDCHKDNLFKSTPTDCASCHLKDDAHAGSLGTQCGTCHSPTGWSPATFDHNTVSFKLTAHQKKSDGTDFACKDCHVKGYASPFDQNTCGDCHLQINQAFATEHFLTFGTNCMACHDGVDSHGKSFDHNKVPFNLIGKHAPVACSQCHVNARNLHDLKATSQDCFSCHAKDDHHNGQFGTDCAACHSPEGWQLAKIDHSKFAFHLDGQHAAVACEKCHINGVFKGTPQDCASCHLKDDAHSGQLGTQCATCHVPDGWKPAKVDHSKFAFHLDGKHATAACTDCHKDNLFKSTPQDCASCHLKDDAHAGSLGTQCGTCHSPTGWSPATFDHNTVSFKLTAHQKKSDGTDFACKDCHVKGYTAPFDQNTCGDCHLQINQAFATEHFLTFGTNCMACHDGVESHGSGFDHNKVPFNLIGKHAPVACSQCHVNARNLHDLKVTSQDCFSCHAKDDHHNGQFGTDCAACHSPEGWQLAKVDHSKFAFHLDGQHAAVACEKCHINGVFKGTPQDCASCHLKDDAHSGQLGTQCATCHVPDGWKPAKVDHSKFAFHLDGKHATAACTDCHKDNLFKGTPQDCASCHLKDDAHSGQLGTQCGTCHSPTGWSPATFDHNTVSFKLTAHQKKSDGTDFACKDCHVKGYVAPFDQNTCGNCHLQINQAFATEHFITFGTDCMACHDGVESHGKSFDHNKVPFNLIGRHAPLACSQCHVAARNLHDLKATSQDCFSCHAKDDHHNGQFGTDCGACHSPEDWSLAKVDHSKFAFHLDGLHATVACEKCHVNGVFKGTPMNCAACHSKNDPHNGTLGNQCESCHSPAGWKPANVDHSKFAFHLDGKHAAVACANCHINGVFKGTPMDCAACHTKDDAHKGTFGNQCATCHNPSDWTQVAFDHNTTRFTLKAHQANQCKDCHDKGFVAPFDQNTCGNCHLQINQTFATEHFITFGTDCMACHDGVDSHGKSFDHNQVPFNLIGKHAPLACSQCHIAARNLHDLKATSQNCFSCHQKDDHHNGQFGTDCAACHSPEGWQLATVDHSLFAFHLDGKHAAVACESCHVNGVFKGTPMDCASCHSKTDPHGGALGNQCDTCHTPNGWKPSNFNHNNSIFKLTGQHVNVLCSNCHTDLKFKGTPTNCAACHSKIDPHAGKLGTDCASCHTTSGWTPSTFDHSRSAFALTGKHTAVACSQCHVDKLFKGTPSDCASCHSKIDPHGGALGTNCAACHSTSGWKPSSFDHNSSIFKLTGQHTTVACTKCHTDLKFKGTPTNCYSCHAADDFHKGQFGTNCAACHATSGWKPSTFDHAKSAFPLTGLHTSVACTSCHINGKFTGTPKDCYSCHASNDRHGGKYGTNCGACHSTSGWKPATFDHSKSAFPLTGAHTNTVCTKCHINNVFSGTPTNCFACHSAKDPHAGKAGTSCGTCHNTTAWKPATFTHTFPLTHGNNPIVACVTCHPSTTSAYTCFSCHEHTVANMADKHKDVKNYSQTTCATCHANGRTP